MIKKIRQNKTWIEVDIPCINLAPSQYNALVPAIVYISNDVTIPFGSMMSQHKEPYSECARMGQKSFWNLQIGTWIQLYVTYRRAKPWMFDNAYKKGNQMKLFH